MSSDSWLAEYNSLDEYAHELIHKMTQRNQFSRNSMAYSRNDVQVRQMCKTMSERINKLSTSLMMSSQSFSLTQMEAERRQRLIDNLNYRCKQMEENINNPNMTGRSALLGNQSLNSTSYGASSSSSTAISFNDGDIRTDTETNAARNLLSADEMRQEQKMMLQVQDKGLDSLADIISRQKFLAHGISSEIDLQNEIIDDIGDAMDQTNSRLERNTRNIRTVSRKSDTCCYWVIIILLFIAILTTAFA